ncbi:hypothetical protein [Deinococcus terrestris]|uniref:hypothetical protein n=1 Tax=Deinococcus terrestris TaxID=2651870 RepID=UPI0018847674|nr:hypothetical protein [Deinococcus terrestris]
MTETDLHYRQSIIALRAPTWLTGLATLLGAGGLVGLFKAFYDALPRIGGRE